MIRQVRAKRILLNTACSLFLFGLGCSFAFTAHARETSADMLFSPSMQPGEKPYVAEIPVKKMVVLPSQPAPVVVKPSPQLTQQSREQVKPPVTSRPAMSVKTAPVADAGAFLFQPSSQPSATPYVAELEKPKVVPVRITPVKPPSVSAPAASPLPIIALPAPVKLSEPAKKAPPVLAKAPVATKPENIKSLPVPVQAASLPVKPAPVASAPVIPAPVVSVSSVPAKTTQTVAAAPVVKEDKLIAVPPVSTSKEITPPLKVVPQATQETMPVLAKAEQAARIISTDPLRGYIGARPESAVVPAAATVAIAVPEPAAPAVSMVSKPVAGPERLAAQVTASVRPDDITVDTVIRDVLQTPSISATPLARPVEQEVAKTTVPEELKVLSEPVAADIKAPDLQTISVSEDDDTEEQSILAVEDVDADKTNTMNLNEVVKTALQTNPQILRGQATEDLYGAALAETIGGQGIQVSGFSNATVERTAQDADNLSLRDSSRGELGLRANYTLYSFGAFRDRRNASEANFQKSGKDFYELQNNLAYEVVAAYLDILRQKSMYDIEKYRIGEYQEFLNRVEQAGAADQILRSQLYLARTGIAQRKQALISIERDYNQSRYLLEKLVGTDLEDVKFAKPKTPIVILPEKKEFIQTAIDASPAIQGLRKAVKAAQFEVSALKNERYGSIDMNMDVARDFIDKERSSDVLGSAQVEYSVPLHTSGLADAQARKQRAQLAQAQADLKIAEEELKQNLKLAYDVIQQNDKIVELAREEEENAEKVLAAYKGEVLYGNRSFSDILGQIDSVASARGRQSASYLSKTLAAYAILRREDHLLDFLKVGEKADDQDEHDSSDSL